MRSPLNKFIQKYSLKVVWKVLFVQVGSNLGTNKKDLMSVTIISIAPSSVPINYSALIFEYSMSDEYHVSLHEN